MAIIVAIGIIIIIGASNRRHSHHDIPDLISAAICFMQSLGFACTYYTDTIMSILLYRYYYIDTITSIIIMCHIGLRALATAAYRVSQIRPVECLFEHVARWNLRQEVNITP